MRYVTHGIIFFLMMLFGCSQPSDKTEHTISYAESIMDQGIDSAKISVKRLSELGNEVSSMSKEQKMKFYLMCAKAQNQAYIDFTSDSVGKIVVEYYDSNGTSIEKMLAHYLLGCAYRDMGEAPLALQCFYESTNYSNGSQEAFDLLSRIYGQMAFLYEKQALVYEQMNQLDSAAHYAFLTGDSVAAYLRINQKATAYSLINKQDSAFVIKDSVIQALLQMGKEQYAAQICGNNYTYLIDCGRFKDVKRLMDFYEQHSGYFQDGEIERGREVYYYNKGHYYLAINKTDSAELMFRKCLRFIADPNMKVAAYHGLSMLYDKLKAADSTAKYALLAYDANDSAYQINVAEKALNIKSLYNYSKHQQAAIESLKERNSAYNWLLVSIVVIIALALTSVFIIKCIRKRSLDKQMQMRERYETEKKLLQREMEELNALLEEKEYIIGNSNETFEKRKRELFLEIEDKEKEILKLQERVLKYEKELSIKDEAETEEMLMHSDIRAQFAYFASHVVEKPSDENWQQLMLFVRSVLPKLFVLLKNNKISEREMKVSLLIRFGFKPGEIATIMDCSFPEVSLIRSRLLKKIYGIDGKAAEFDRRLMLMY